MSGPSLRNAQLQDAPGIVACIDAAYAAYDDQIDDLPPVSEGIERDIAENQVWLVEQDATIVGVLVLVVTGEDFSKLANLAVHPDHAGKGLGRALIDHAVSLSQSYGFDEIRLNTHVDMTDNIRLYEHLGWHQTDRQGATVTLSCKI